MTFVVPSFLMFTRVTDLDGAAVMALTAIPRRGGHSMAIVFRTKSESCEHHSVTH